MKLSELKVELEKLLKPKYSYSDFELEVKLDSEQVLEIKISQMYDYVEIQFDQLSAIAQMLQTKHINIGEREGSGGCSTCDYGSCYMVPIYVKNIQVPLEEG